MDTGFWVGLGAAVPLSVVANLATPAVQNWLANRNSRLDEERQKQRASMDQLIEYFKANNLAYASFISNNFMRLLFVAVLMFIVLNIPFYVQIILVAAGPLASIFTIPVLTALLVSFMNTSRKTRHVMRAITPDVPPNFL